MMTSEETQICIMCGRVFRRKGHTKCKWCTDYDACPHCGGFKGKTALACIHCTPYPYTPLRQMTITEVSWLTGIIEGEGSFIAKKKSGTCRVLMTDEDIIRRVHALTGVGQIYMPTKQQDHHKQAWSWTVQKSKNVQQICDLIFLFLSPHRQEQIIRAVPELSPTTAQTLDLIAWSAGYCEGEAWFGRSNGHSPTISVGSTDREPLERLTIAHGGRIGGPRRYGADHFKPVYTWSLTGIRAGESMTTMLPFMGQRRTNRIKEVLQAFTPTERQLKIYASTFG